MNVESCSVGMFCWIILINFPLLRNRFQKILNLAGLKKLHLAITGCAKVEFEFPGMQNSRHANRKLHQLSSANEFTVRLQNLTDANLKLHPLNISLERNPRKTT